ncbi:hypothetical protein L2725_08645 [Shewanella corallii]|uniref:Toxin co-regulated pilus biosynthesis protein Q C-terminal domain-containing protein n=1 Tax=Shewanella corallii TaxID=560080 RepID=A0ABT0N652_9GAMM|nr:hypothetical protein [Shewanella corallii]MCL2913860.1 hypothetical protein [Shewanella corallii]
MKRIICLLFLAQLFTVHAENWPEINFPPKAQVQIVADDMEYNGYPMRTWAVMVPGNKDKVIKFFMNQWQSSSEKFSAVDFNGDFIINSLQPPFLLTARISEDLGQTRVLVGITKNLDENALNKVARTRFPKPSNTDVISEVKSKDPLKQGTTTILLSERGLSSTYHFYKDYYRRAGWQGVRDILDTTEGKASLRFNRGTEFVDVSFSTRDSHVYIVANQVKEGN